MARRAATERADQHVLSALGIAAGKVLWRVFATNFGVVPVPVVKPLLLAVLMTAVLGAANVLAAVPALLAARSHPGQLLRAE